MTWLVIGIVVLAALVAIQVAVGMGDCIIKDPTYGDAVVLMSKERVRAIVREVLTEGTTPQQENER